MKKNILSLISLILLLNLCEAQEKLINFTQQDIESYQNQASQLIKFLEYTLNTVGSSKSTQKEKETIINESFLKLFVNENVQVEDDLDEFRTVPTNKHIQAYLKDIDFFFREVKFKFTIEDVSYQISENNYLFFKFQLNRNMNAKLFNGDTINSDKIRFIEINFDDTDQDLKIASIYTTKLNEKEELQNWWNTMPQIWKDFLGKEILINDSIQLSKIILYKDSFFVHKKDVTNITNIDTFLVFNDEQDTLFINERDSVKKIFYDTIAFDSNSIYQYLKEFVAIQELSIPDSLGIDDIDPLSKFTKLRKLSIAGSPVKNLIPLRNLTKLNTLDCQGTQITTLHPLSYSVNLKYLDFSNTLVWDLSPVAKFSSLERLYFNNTPIEELYPLAGLKNLQDLRLANSNVRKLDSIKSLNNLEILNISSTNVSSINALAGMQNLRILTMNNTLIKDLTPLEKTPKIATIYCDNTNIKFEEAQRFIQKKPQCKVIFESKELSNWWEDLDNVWKQIFRKYETLNEIPTTEQLHELPKIKILDISNQSEIKTLDPLRKLIQLEKLVCKNTKISDLTPIRDLVDLKYLDASYTNISNLLPIQNLKKLEYIFLSNSLINDIIHLKNLNDLKELYLDNTDISSLEPISLLSQLQKVYADKTKIDLIEIRKFRIRQPNCLVVFRTTELERWWIMVNQNWKIIFQKAIQIQNDTLLSREELHQISTIEKININNITQLNNLIPLSKLTWLKELRFSGTQIINLTPLKKNINLEYIECANNPISDLSDIMNLPKLKYLDISNIPIKNFEQIQNMKKLEVLICPGTNIKSLKYLDLLINLNQLEIYNTNVKNISPIETLSLNLLKCYNTKIPSKKIEEFKKAHRKCEVIYY